jgi:hypothetical protein
VNDAECCLVELLGELEKPALDTLRVERSSRSLAASLARLSPETPRIELERILALHAALRALVERRHADVGRSLEAVLRARERIACLTRPQDAKSVFDLRV